MKITHYTDPTSFNELAEAWDDLVARIDNAPLFMTVDYQRIWWQHLGHGKLHLLACHTDDDQLVGIAPFFISDNIVRFIGCVDVSDYLDFLIDPAHHAEVYHLFVNYWSKHLAGECRHAYLCSLPERSTTLADLPPLCRALGWQVKQVQEEVCPVITLADSWDGYLAGIKKKQRHELRRKLRRAENQADTRWYVIDTATELTDNHIDIFVELHRKSTPEKDEFWDETLLTFFRAFIWRAAEKGWLKFYFVEIDGQPAAGLLCFDYHNELLLYNSGFDLAQFGHFSPGNIIVAYAIQHAIDLGRTRFDFLRGDEEYKFRFGAVAEAVYALKIRMTSDD